MMRATLILLLVTVGVASAQKPVPPVKPGSTKALKALSDALGTDLDDLVR